MCNRLEALFIQTMTTRENQKRVQEKWRRQNPDYYRDCDVLISLERGCDHSVLKIGHLIVISWQAHR